MFREVLTQVYLIVIVEVVGGVVWFKTAPFASSSMFNYMLKGRFVKVQYRRTVVFRPLTPIVEAWKSSRKCSAYQWALHLGVVEVVARTGLGYTHKTDRLLLKAQPGSTDTDLYRRCIQAWSASCALLGADGCAWEYIVYPSVYEAITRRLRVGVTWRWAGAMDKARLKAQSLLDKLHVKYGMTPKSPVPLVPEPEHAEHALLDKVGCHTATIVFVSNHVSCCLTVLTSDHLSCATCTSLQLPTA